MWGSIRHFIDPAFHTVTHNHMHIQRHQEHSKSACACVCMFEREGEIACVSVTEGYVKAISSLFNLSERELAHFHNHHLPLPDPPQCCAAEPPVQDSETSLCGIQWDHLLHCSGPFFSWCVLLIHLQDHCLATLEGGVKSLSSEG